MSGTEHRPGDEQAFEEYLGGRSPLGDSYERLKDLQPPEDLDRMILEQAREAAEGHKAWSRPGWLRWLPAAGVATVLVGALAVLLVPRVTDESGAGLESFPLAAYEVLPSQEVVVSALQREGTERDAEAGEGLARTTPEIEAALTAPEFMEVLPDSAVPRPSAEPAPVTMELAARARSADASVVGMSVGAPGQADAADDEAAAHPPRGDDASTARRQRAAAVSSLAGVAPEDGASRALAMEAAVPMSAREPEAEADRLEQYKRLHEAARGYSQVSEQAPGGAVSVAALIDRMRGDPEEWLGYIDWLLDAGRMPEARDELEAFRNRYPDRELDERYDLP